MLRQRVSRYRRQFRRELTAAFEAEEAARRVAASFAIGVFITTLPSGGAGVGLFVVLAYWWSWVNKTAMFASLLVLNPFVKPAVYVASYRVGAGLLGTDPLIQFDWPLLDALLAVVQRVVIGNVLLALALAAVGYTAVLYLARSYRRSDGTATARLPGPLAEGEDDDRVGD
ncbi:DUF2062 domain-containing protein [Salinilacihabitans rarus]|uniref:DUF2062 domain-containing protein n=1 Tax=Salinilacihabitans rarus TaxID=2961596 RepID=UPI0020C8E217|nr:DUF2062 domain-containing protein [Salinilacihabitans rarus]